MSKAVIIGAGIAGIATAIRLSAKGYHVEVYESNAYPGGKLSAFSQDGFRFDAGPSLFTMPQFVEELFALHHENVGDHFEYVKLKVGCHYFYDDGTTFKSSSNADEFAGTIGEVLHEDSNKVREHLLKSALIYKITSPVFLENSLHKLKTYFSRNGIYGILNLWRLDIFSSMNSINSKRFSNPKTVQFFNRFATYNGSNPYKAPATLNIIPHLEFGFGTYFPKKGMISITDSLVALAERHGVKFFYNKKVDRILFEDKKATGIKVGDVEIIADKVICNMDVYPAYKYLLSGIRMPSRVRHLEPSSSAVIFYWGIKREFSELGLHNIFFSKDYKKEFDVIFNDGSISDDPTVYINITSKLKKDDAPRGNENWFVMINVPSNTGQDWDELIRKAKADIIVKLGKILNADIASLIISESILDPRSIESRTSGYRGALYGSSSNKKMAAFLRHANFSSSIANLYFCGGSVHPGGGIPLCLLSAKITSGLIGNRHK